MPKTFTNDLAAVLPAAITGPMLVASATNPDNLFRLDPAGARIEAAGDARPLRRLHVPISRITGVAISSFMSSAMDARSLGPTVDAGMFLAPFVVPLDLDVGAPVRVALLVAPAADGGAGGIVRFELACSFGKDGDTNLGSSVIALDWPVPAGWTTQDIRQVWIDASSGTTFAPGTFQPGDCVGLLARRLGASASDTYVNSLLVAPMAIWEYRALSF